MTTYEPITVEEARRLLIQALHENGDLGYVYDQGQTDSGECVYLDRNEEEGFVPSCLVGHVLVYHGVETGDILAWEGNNAYSVLTQLLDHKEGDVVVTALQDAQSVQDTGGTWADAYDAFERTIRNAA